MLSLSYLSYRHCRCRWLSATLINLAIPTHTPCACDQQLRFKSHIQQSVKKGTNAALALNRIANSSRGAPYKYVRQLYQAVVAPRLDYASVIWNQPKADRSASATAYNQKFTTVQRIAMTAILGCFHTAPNTAMEMESGLQPAWLRLQTKSLTSVTRMQSLSTCHPIHAYIAEALQTRTTCLPYTSILENIFRQFHSPHGGWNP
jgi:hypothetical protein